MNETVIQTPEKAVLAACLTYLNTLPYVNAWRQNSGAYKASYQGKQRFVRFGQPGQADITGMVNGIRLEVEVKATGKRPSETQLEWLCFIQANGGISFWCDSVDACSVQMKRVFEERGLNWKTEWSL